MASLVNFPSLFSGRLSQRPANFPVTCSAASPSTLSGGKKQHFVLVHGAGHGAWCWYKVAPLLESAGYNVSAMDLASCGVNPKSADKILSFDEYIEPLTNVMASVPDGERVVIVGHSYGGVAVSLAMETFSEKIDAGVFVTANVFSPKYSIIDFYGEVKQPKAEVMMDSKLYFGRGSDKPPTSVLLGPKRLASRMYQLCSPEDLKLATFLVRPAVLLQREAMVDIKFTEEKLGSVRQVYIVCKDDKAGPEEYQRMMAEKAEVEEIMEIEGADHMAMLSKPQELFKCLLEIAEKVA